MPYIIAPTYTFFNHNATLYGIAEPAPLVNGQDERGSPAVDKYVCPCLCGGREGENNECLWYSLISVRIVLFLYKDFGAIWAPKRQIYLLF